MNPDQDKRLLAEMLAPAAPTEPIAPLLLVEPATPSAGGCYIRDPATGELTLSIPSTQPE